MLALIVDTPLTSYDRAESLTESGVRTLGLRDPAVSVGDLRIMVNFLIPALLASGRSRLLNLLAGPL